MVLHTFSALHSNTNGDGASPHGELILSGSSLYGTTALGGTLGGGTVFKINVDGTGFVNLHNFASGPGAGNPNPGLALSGDTLFGTTQTGGAPGNGTLFKLSTNGCGWQKLHHGTKSLILPALSSS